MNQEIKNKIEQLKKEIDTYRPLSKDAEGRIMQKFRLDWNFHSNNIEGNQLTFGETKTFLLHGITADKKPLKDHLDIKGHNEALLYLESIIHKEDPITETFIRGLHEVILKEPYDNPAITPEGKKVSRKIHIGQYKSKPNHVITATGETFYFASPEETPAKMHDLILWYRKSEEENELHPLELAAQFHYKFIRIHPFDDGNGRMARILMNLILMRSGFPPVVIKTQDKDNYFKALRGADGGDIDSFEDYIARNLVDSLELFLRGAKGEDISELSDIDKEIALLKKELDSENQFNIVAKSEKTLDEAYRNVFRPLFNTLFQYLDTSFESMFYSKDIYIEIIMNGKDITNRNQLFDNIWLNTFYRNLKEKGVFSERINLTYKLKGFSKNEDNAFNIDVKSTIFLHEFKYQIEFQNNVLLEKLYTGKASKKETDIIIQTIAKSVLNFIKQKIKR